MENTLSVSEITTLLFYQKANIKGQRVPEEILRQGQIVHSRLGFNNIKMFQRYWFSETTNSWWLIRGMPDKINDKEGVVEELKTYYKWTRKTQIEAGRVAGQIYCWLLGFKKFRIYFYNTLEEKIEKVEEYEFDEQKVKEYIEKAIKLKLLIGEFLKKYDEILE